MLGILRVNAGISFEGVAEFTLTIADANERVYEVQIDDVAYAQLIGVIEETSRKAPELEPTGNGSNGSKLASLSPEKRAALANLLTQKNEEMEQQPQLASSPIGLADVGFDYDYSADEDDEEDPGEIYDDEYVEPI